MQINFLRCKGIPPCFATTLAHGDKFYDFLFKLALQIWDLLLQKRKESVSLAAPTNLLKICA